MNAHRILLATAAIALAVVGCAANHPGAAVVDKIRATSSPIVREVLYSPASWPDSPNDVVEVYLVDEATDAQALQLWCTVVVPAGVSQLKQGALGLYKGGEVAPGGGRYGAKLILKDPVVCPGGSPPVSG